MSAKRSGLELGACLASAWAAGAIGGALSRGSQPDYYKSLNRPSWSPPARVFGPVWMVLYTLMGTAAWLLRRNRHKPGGKTALGLYAGQLGLNASWSPIFFGLHRPRAALYDLGALWATVAGLTASSWRVDRKATILLLPYLAWTTFAGVLNKRIVDLNPQAGKPQSVGERLRGRLRSYIHD